MIIIANAFSLNMLVEDANISFHKCLESELAHIVRDIQGTSNVQSIVGHADTARVFSNILGVTVEPNRVNYSWNGKDQLLIGQYVGPRLPEGATELPEGAKIVWWTMMAN